MGPTMGHGANSALPAGITQYTKHPQHRRFTGKWSQGFSAFLESGELTDCVVVVMGTEFRAHALLLAYHSEFFRRAFTSDFKEKQQCRVTLGFDDPAGVWPTMLSFFYTDEIILTDDTVLPLLAMSRELMVRSIEDYCSAYAQSSLEANNAIHYLNQAVQYNCDSFRESCVALVAESFPLSFNKPTDNLPTEVILEVLDHPGLVVQTEEQVLHFVMTYVRQHQLGEEVTHALFEQVRFPFLSNERLALLTQEEVVPKDLLMPAMALRFALLDRPDRLAQLALMQGVQAMQAQVQAQVSAAVAAAGGRSSMEGPDTLSRAGSYLLPLQRTCSARQPTSTHSTSSTGNSEHRLSIEAAAEQQAQALALAAAGIPVPPHSPTPRQPSGVTATAFTGGASSSTPQLRTAAPLQTPSSALPLLTSAAHMEPGGSQGLASLSTKVSSGLAGASTHLLGCLAPAAQLPAQMLLPRKTYICTLEYGLPGGSEYACVPLHEVWEDLVPQLHVRVSGDVVEGDAQSILRVHDQETAWFMVSGETGGQPVWIEVELPPNMRVVELSKFTFSHGMNFANHMFPYGIGISDAQWFQMRGLFVQVSEGDAEPLYPLRTSETSAMQLDYTISVEGGGQNMPGTGTGSGTTMRVPPWRRLRLSSSDEQSGSVRLSVRKLRLFGKVEISLMREGPEGARDVLAAWRRRKEAAAARQQPRKQQSMLHGHAGA